VNLAGPGGRWRRAAATLDEIIAERKSYLGIRNFALLHRIPDQLLEITDPYERQARPR
jgi:hypothetical protein